MKSGPAGSDQNCPRREIAAYLDGELRAAEELDLELHIGDCELCQDELNEQKRLLFALDGALDEAPEIDLPENFAKVVATSAECQVEGLRCPVERGRALFVCLLLGVLLIVGVGADSAGSLRFVGSAAERVVAVGAFFSHLLIDLLVATSVIMRSVGVQVVSEKTAIPAGLLVVAGASSAYFVSKFLRHKRF